MEKIGDRLRGVQTAYDDAIGKLSTGTGNLQTELLKTFGAQTSKSLRGVC
jgi:DNA recombination protein RmuC